MADILCRIFAALLFAGLAGGILASLLRGMGEVTAAQEGRLSFNPFNHVLLSGIFLAIAFRSSWIAPLPLQRGKRQFVPLLAAGLTLGLLLALVPLLDLLRLPLHAALPRNLGYMALSALETSQVVLVGGVCIGILPLPGMLLGQSLPAVWPRLEKPFRKYRNFGLVAVALVFILGWFPDVTPLVKALRLI